MPRASAGCPPARSSSLRRSPIAALAAVAYAVILADLLTKLFAVSLIGSEPVTVLDGVRFGLVFNDSGPFGIPRRELGIEVSTILSFALILVMLRVCRELTAVDPSAPLMLGLITGAGAANHIDMLASPRGVADFIAIELGALEGIVFNVADVALFFGLLLWLRTAGRLALRVFEERRPALALAGGGSALGGEAGRGAATQREVQRVMPVFREPEAVAFLSVTDDARSRGPIAAPTHTSTIIEDARVTNNHDGGTRTSTRLGALLSLPSRFDRAATPALVIACTFILVYSLAIVWLPDAGRSAPNALILALAVFGTVFVVVYAEMVLADRRESRAAERASVERSLEDEAWRPVLASSGDAIAASELTIFDGSLPGTESGEAPAARNESHVSPQSERSPRGEGAERRPDPDAER